MFDFVLVLPLKNCLLKYYKNKSVRSKIADIDLAAVHGHLAKFAARRFPGGNC